MNKIAGENLDHSNDVPRKINVFSHLKLTLFRGNSSEKKISLMFYWELICFFNDFISRLFFFYFSGCYSIELCDSAMDRIRFCFTQKKIWKLYKHILWWSFKCEVKVR